MKLPSDCRLTVEDKPAPAARGRLERELGRYNAGFFDHPKWQRLGVFVRDAEDDIVAGLAAHTYAGWLFVENLWVQDPLRRCGLGSELLARAEERARERGCHSAWLDTWSFQAPEFYPKFGYTVFGSLEYPPGFKRLFLQKRL
jgi:GNAT superfamily N-acetyltransferase